MGIARSEVICCCDLVFLFVRVVWCMWTESSRFLGAPVSSNERYFLLKLLFDTLFVLASVFWANERYLVFER